MHPRGFKFAWALVQRLVVQLGLEAQRLVMQLALEAQRLVMQLVLLICVGSEASYVTCPFYLRLDLLDLFSFHLALSFICLS